MKTALIAGATGLVGKRLLERLLASDRYAMVIALSRSPLSTRHAKLTNIITGFGDLGASLTGFHADDVFCCLGTTIAKAGSKEKFYEVDFQYPLNLAQAGLHAGARQYLIVSTLGADRHSPIFYNRVKGEIEQAIHAVGYETVHIFRPSLLLGLREEKRPGEDAAKALYKLFSFAIPSKYKAISADKVASAMADAAAKDMKGTFTHASRDMRRVP